MKVLVLGGTGFLGYHITTQFVRHGAEVHTVATRRVGIEGFQAVRQHRLDLLGATSDQLEQLMHGMDVVVHAFGADDRAPVPAPASRWLARELVEPTRRIVGIARRSGVASVVVLGSYFTTMHRLHPDWQLAARHPYVLARLAQADAAVWAGEHGRGPRARVSMLELPYVFGVRPGLVPFWKDALFDRVLALPVAALPRGATTVTTVRQVAEAALGAALHGEHGGRYPVGDIDLTWTELFSSVLEAAGRRPRVVTVPAQVATLGMVRDWAKARAGGLEYGLDPLRLMGDIMARRMTFDPAPSRSLLGFSSGGVPQALTETLRACYPGMSQA